VASIKRDRIGAGGATEFAIGSCVSRPQRLGRLFGRRAPQRRRTQATVVASEGDSFYSLNKNNSFFRLVRYAGNAIDQDVFSEQILASLAFS
jgi:hypothetical protein